MARVEAWLVPVVVGMVAASILLGDVIFQFPHRVPGDFGDARHNAYVLEHGYRTLALERDVQKFWNAPFFFPAGNTIALGENLLGTAPLYWALRSLGLTIEASLHAWILSVLVLNYAAAVVWLQRGLRVSPLAASLGAVLFTFGASRLAQINHAQLLPQFYSVGAAFALQRFFERLEERKSARRWLAVFFATSVAQLYACLYLGWFLAFSLGIVLAWSVALAPCRRRLARALRLHGGAAAVLGLAALVAVAPLAGAYVRGSQPAWDFAHVATFLPHPGSWLYAGEASWMYGWAASLPGLEEAGGPEKKLFLGLATTLLAALGLWRHRGEPLVRLLALASVTIVVLVTWWPGDIVPWRFVAAVVPVAGDIRAIARIALMLLLPMAVGVAYFFDGRRPAVVLLLGLLLVLEQGRALPSYDAARARKRVDRLERRLDTSACRYFYYSPIIATGSSSANDSMLEIVSSLDAMLLEQRVGVPTLNGYASKYPPGGHRLARNVIRTEEDEERLSRALARWTAERGLDFERLCWIRLDAERKRAGRR